jgi:Holliday junction resolvase RusA-like endonuclease
MISFFVPGRPRSTQTGSVIRVGHRAIPIRRNTAWSSVAGLVARQHAPSRPWLGPVRVSMLFVLPRPKAKRATVAVRPDLENLCKGLLDSWNGVLYHDDSQVVSLWLRKVYEDDRLSVGVLVNVAQGEPPDGKAEGR